MFKCLIFITTSCRMVLLWHCVFLDFWCLVFVLNVLCYIYWCNKTFHLFHHRTLGVVGVVGCLSPIVGHFEGAKVPNFDEKPPVFFLSEQSSMSTLSAQKFWAKQQLIISRNSAKHFWAVCPIVKFQKKQNLESGVVLLCWILLRSFKLL